MNKNFTEVFFFPPFIFLLMSCFKKECVSKVLFGTWEKFNVKGKKIKGIQTNILIPQHIEKCSLSFLFECYYIIKIKFGPDYNYNDYASYSQWKYFERRLRQEQVFSVWLTDRIQVILSLLWNLVIFIYCRLSHMPIVLKGFLRQKTIYTSLEGLS